MILCREDRDMDSITQDEIPRLIAAARQDPAAFARVYECYVQPIYRYALSRTGSVHEAEDITSQTFITAYESLKRYDERGQFSAWLFRIARSKIIDHFRRSKREVGLQAAGRIVEQHDTLGSLIYREQLGRLREIIRGATEAEQDLIRLRYVADLSFAEMAEVLGKREEAVKKSLYRLLGRLKDQME